MAVREKVIWDQDGNRLQIQTTMDVEPIIDGLKAQTMSNPTGMSRSGNWQKVGSIPMIVVADYLQRGINLLEPGNEKYLERALNEYTHFRYGDSPVSLSRPRST